MRMTMGTCMFFLGSGLATMSGCADRRDGIWMLAYFRTPDEALHFAYSTDGLKWTPLNGNKPVLRATAGHKSIRDPFIRRGPDGWFHLLSTNSWKSRNLLYTRSRDLIHWEPQTLLLVMESIPEVRNVWAPEFVYDTEKREYLIFWSSITKPEKHQRIWCCRTKDFRKCSQPTVLFDPGYSVIDATIVRKDLVWVMVYKDERGANKPDTDNKAMRVAAARSLGGPYASPSGLITPHLTEGPAVFRIRERWLMLYDHFMEGKWGAAESSDLSRWTIIGQGLLVPPASRHGTVFPISREEFTRLRQAWPGPTAERYPQTHCS